MKSIISSLGMFMLFAIAHAQDSGSEKWISLFDGKSLNNWKVGANAETFSVDSGMIIAHGKTAHLFYDGPVNNHQFKNFELKVELRTYPGSNSGIYFHTAYQEKSWPVKGYEVQINNSHVDWRRTGSLYGMNDIREKLVDDYVWFTETIRVEGKHVIIKVNDKIVVEYTEPDDVKRGKGNEQRLITNGTFALQGHDPNSIVQFKNIMLRLLPD